MKTPIDKIRSIAQDLNRSSDINDLFLAHILYNAIIAYGDGTLHDLYEMINKRVISNKLGE